MSQMFKFTFREGFGRNAFVDLITNWFPDSWVSGQFNFVLLLDTFRCVI